MTGPNAVFDHNSKRLSAEEMEDTVILHGHSAGYAGDVVQNAWKGEG